PRELRDASRPERARHDDSRRRAERCARTRRREARVRARDGPRCPRRQGRGAAPRRLGAEVVPRILMANFAQQVVSGLASGGIYALLALAIVLIHRSTGVINFAQGELATLSAFVCFTLMNHGWAFWPAFLVTLLLSL